MPDISNLLTTDVVGPTDWGGLGFTADGEVKIQNDAGTNAFTIDVNGSAELQVVDNEIGVPAGDSLSVYNVGGPGDTNYERLRMYWDTNVAYIAMEPGGTGTQREVQLVRDGTIMLRSTTAGLYSGQKFMPHTNGLNLGDTVRNWGNIYLQPSSSVTPSSLNGTVTIEFTNNTTLTFYGRGTDGVLRSGTVTLS